MARLDGPAAQQYLVFPFGYAAHHDLRILIMDNATSNTYMTGQIIAFRDAQIHLRSAVATGAFDEDIS